PFGNSRGVLGAVGNANLYRFSSKMYIATHGLYYYGYRFYNPGLQRWMNRDPIGELGGVNLYAFGWNNPSYGVDPFGLTFSPALPPGMPYLPIYSPPEPPQPSGPIPPPNGCGGEGGAKFPGNWGLWDFTSLYLPRKN